MRLAVISLALFISACTAPAKWHRDGATERDFRMEHAQCRVEAAKVPDPIIGMTTVNNCLIGKGWERAGSAQRPRS
jgi:hypothetical protein